MLITETRVKEQMNAITDSFVSQLRSALAIAGDATWTAAQRRSWIASRLPADDCWTIVPDERAIGELALAGEEGADITLTPLYGHQQISEKPAGAALPGDHKNDRGAALPAGLRTEKQILPQISGKADVPLPG